MEFIKWFGGPSDFHLQLEKLVIFDLYDPKLRTRNIQHLIQRFYQSSAEMADTTQN